MTALSSLKDKVVVNLIHNFKGEMRNENKEKELIERSLKIRKLESLSCSRDSLQFSKPEDSLQYSQELTWIKSTQSYIIYLGSILILPSPPSLGLLRGVFLQISQ